MSPIVLTLVGVMSAVFMITVYHCVLVRICDWRQSLRTTNNAASMQGGEEAPDSLSLETSFVQLIPAYKYKEEGKVGGNGSLCAVCLFEFEEGEELRRLPECLHPFHLPCIDEWLHSHPNCPLCRANMAACIFRQQTEDQEQAAPQSGGSINVGG